MLILFALSVGCSTWTRAEQSAANAYNSGNTFREAGKLEKAVEAYREALTFQPRMAAASFNLALTLSKVGKNDEALEILQKLRERDPNNRKIIRAQGWVSLQKGEPRKAITYYLAALSLFESDKKVLQSLVDIYKEIQEIEEATKYQKMLLRLEDSTENHLLLAELYISGGLLEEAVYEYEWVFVHSGPQPAALLSAGELSEELSLLEEAMGYYQRAGQTESQESKTAWFRLARLRLLEFIDFQGGLSALETALKQGFNDDEALHALILEVQPELIPTIQEMISGQNPPPQEES